MDYNEVWVEMSDILSEFRELRANYSHDKRAQELLTLIQVRIMQLGENADWEQNLPGVS